MSGGILIFGTGAFAARIACDIAATAGAPVAVTLAGRNRERLDWLVTAGNARAETFGSGARFHGIEVDLLQRDAAAPVIDRVRPALVVQAASVQTSAVIATKGDAWSRFVAEGGLSATAVFQALLTARVAQAIAAVGATAQLINCCFPDGVNAMIAGLGLPVACGVGNIQILSSAFGGALGPGGMERTKVVAHYQCIGAWRKKREDRAGSPVPRVWIDDVEERDPLARFADVRLTPEPAIEISGSAGVPLMLAMAEGKGTIHAHAPGPMGLPGGYPIVWRDGVLDLDLPSGISPEEAVAFNLSFEQESGMVVQNGVARYTGKLRDLMRQESPDLAEGFAVKDLETVHEAMAALRRRLQART